MSFELQGKYDTAKVFTDNVDETTISQIIEFLNQPFSDGANTRIMPDCHAGKGAVVGTTMKVKDKIVPNVVGVDIGCGMLCVEIEKTKVDFEKLDEAIRKLIPHGQGIRDRVHPYIRNVSLDDVMAPFSLERATLSLGSLGSGNHFIELNESEDGRLFIVIHSGSRHLGVKVATYHQKKAAEYHNNNKDEIQALINKLKAEGRHREIEGAIKAFKSERPKIPNDLAYLEGKLMEDYLHDLRVAQDFAKWNRAAMVQVILEAMNFKEIGRIDTIHNYVDLDNMILRKGAISAQEGELVLIPINMRDGSLLARGKGNPEWNYSAPHGAGRILSRSKAKEQLSLDEFKETMKDVYTTSVDFSTLDEAPMAYKSMQEIIDNTTDTIEIVSVLKPLYNFKASE